jgi:hypothetical protein
MLRSRLKIGLLVGVLALMPLNQAWSFGASGHAIIAEIAQRRVEPGVLRKMKELLGGEVSLASIANWADHVALLRPNTVNWHFVNIPLEAASYDPQRDCSPTPKGDCVIKAIERARATLADGARPRDERREALMFLVHLVGDVHQPLHCTDRNDAGGNRVTVMFFNAVSSLHMVWDVGMIEKRTYDFGEYVTTLETDWLPGKDVAALQKGDVVDWALESHQAAVTVAYGQLPPDYVLGDAYYQASRPVLDRQLAVAGLRLARLLNETLGD